MEHQEPKAVDLYDFPPPKIQASDRWLGGGESGGVAQALKFTAEFLMNEGKIRNPVEDFSKHVNPRYVQMVLDGAC